jgi:hypothetical protein
MKTKKIDLVILFFALAALTSLTNGFYYTLNDGWSVVFFLDSKISLKLISQFLSKENLNENSALISDFRIDYDPELTIKFPDRFSVSLNELGESLNIEFFRILENPALNSRDIYVIDKLTGQPKRYDLKDEEVTA